jgi:hypothetical protein
MKKKSKADEARSRIDALVEPGRRGGYFLSSAAADPLKRRLRGKWRVRDHFQAGEPYLERFAARALKGVRIDGASYLAEYEFREGICLKRVEINGAVAAGDSAAEYRYRLRVASSWDLDGAAALAIRPELGYQCTELGGETAAVKDLDDPVDPVSVSFRFEGDALVLEEGDDVKRLERVE